MPRKPQDTTQGRNLLLTVSRRLFLEHGYAQVSMQQIAQEAGMTKGAPYYHFASKEDLFTQVSIGILGDLFRTAAVAATDDVPFERRIRRSMREVVASISGDFSQWYSDLMRLKNVGMIDEALEQAFGSASLVDVLAPIFEQARSEGAFTRVSAREAATMYFVLMKAAIDHAAVLERSKLAQVIALKPLIDLMVDVYFNGIR